MYERETEKERERTLLGQLIAWSLCSYLVGASGGHFPIKSTCQPVTHFKCLICQGAQVPTCAPRTHKHVQQKCTEEPSLV